MKNKIEKSLIVPEKETIFSRFFKWIKNIFHAEEIEEMPQIAEESITIPKSIKKTEKPNEATITDENSLEYLYRLSEEELDKLDDVYEKQMESAKDEIFRLNDILQSYKQSIKQLQNKVETDF